MSKKSLTKYQEDLTIELLGYTLLRVCRYFHKGDFDNWKGFFSETDIEINPSGSFDESAQYDAREGALLADSVSVFNRAIRSLEKIDVVEDVHEALFYKVSVSFERLGTYLPKEGHLNLETFEYAVYDFFGCHRQAEWGSASLESGHGHPVRSSIVTIEPGLEHRFEAAGLIEKSGSSYQWTELTNNYMSPMSVESFPTVSEFFERIYSLDD